MPTRRELIRSAAALAAAAPLAGCSWPGSSGYDALVAETWRLGDAQPASERDAQLELVRYATLAANGHNTQPWRFKLAPGEIAILPDLSRRTQVVDPDDHHLYASLGCAAENIVQAAPALGLNATPRYDEAADAVLIGLEPAPATSSALFEAIPERQSTRAAFDGKPAGSAELAALDAAGRADDVDLFLLTDKSRIENVVEYVAEGNSAQLADRNFVQELKDWIRFNETEAVARRDGLFTGASGNPTLPRWIASPLFGFFLTADGENAKYAEHIRSSAGIAVFSAQSDAPAGWVAAGRACERFSLQATALGLRTAFLNQPVEVPEIRPQFAAWLGIPGRRPDLVMRFGAGPLLPRSLRRPVKDVIA